MKNGYQAELDGHGSRLGDLKGSLEELYAERNSDEAIDTNEALKKRLEDLVSNADMAMLNFQNGIKIVKAAVAPRFP